MSEEKATKQFKMSEHERELNRKRVAKSRAKKKAENQNQEIPTQENTATTAQSSYANALKRFNELVNAYSGLGVDGIYAAFARAGQEYSENMPTIQNKRVKAISSLPADYTKEEIGEFLRNPYFNEKALRQTSEILKWTAYPFFKITKTYQDILTYRHFTSPKYITKDDPKTEEFKREERLLDKLNKAIKPSQVAHKIAGKAVTSGKVFYYPRIKVDKVHNKVDFAFLQQLPSDWCTIIGFNNKSGYTVSFNMMYFVQIGTDPLQYGDLFKPYLADFNDMFIEPKDKKIGDKIAYASVKGKNGTYNFYPDKAKENALGEPRVFKQDGEWFYWVSLPVSKVWAFEIDDTTVAVASPLSGLMLTYAQQSDYEAAQLSLLLNPLIKIFTGEIPFFNENGSTTEDGFRLSLGARAMFETMFGQLMAQNNTAGTAFFSAPVTNIKSHDYTESANANKISMSFNQYGMSKAGLSGIIPVDDEVKAGQAELSSKLESRFATCIYEQFEKMMESVYEELNLRYSWKFTMFGSIYTDDKLRESLEKALANGDISVYPYLAALDGQSMLDKTAIMYSVKGSDFLEMLTPPATSYTQAKGDAGRPKNETVTEGNEKSTDAGAIE